MSSLQATQSSSMESLESSMSTTESTIGAVCVCARMYLYLDRPLSLTTFPEN